MRGDSRIGGMRQIIRVRSGRALIRPFLAAEAPRGMGAPCFSNLTISSIRSASRRRSEAEAGILAADAWSRSLTASSKCAASARSEKGTTRARAPVPRRGRAVIGFFSEQLHVFRMHLLPRRAGRHYPAGRQRSKLAAWLRHLNLAHAVCEKLL